VGEDLPNLPINPPSILAAAGAQHQSTESPQSIGKSTKFILLSSANIGENEEIYFWSLLALPLLATSYGT
jgi:hypothetical protein